jgi:multiple sugar transport system permease protein
MRLVTRGVRFVILAAFAVFFVVPIVWLIAAPTKSDEELVTKGPFTFGSFHNVALAWDHLDAFSNHIYRAWIGNSLLYAFGATRSCWRPRCPPATAWRCRDFRAAGSC